MDFLYGETFKTISSPIVNFFTMTLSTILSLVTSMLAVTCATAGPPLPTATALARSGISWINYTTITGYFLQDDSSTIPGTFDYVSEGPQLVPRAFAKHVLRRRRISD